MGVEGNVPKIEEVFEWLSQLLNGLVSQRKPLLKRANDDPFACPAPLPLAGTRL